MLDLTGSACNTPGMDRRLAALAVGVVVLSALAGVLFQLRAGGERPVGVSGFDIASVAPASPSALSASAPRDPARSGLGMVLSLPGISVDGAPAPAARPPSAPATEVQDAVRRAEGPISALAQDYTRRSAVIRQYGRDWMSYPDLKKLNDDYMRRHDPVAFLIGLSASRSFPLLLKKYATEKIFRDFILDGTKAAPADALQTAFETVTGDARMKGLVDNVSRSLGFPADAMAQAAGGSAVKLDGKQLAKIVSAAQDGKP